MTKGVGDVASIIKHQFIGVMGREEEAAARDTHTCTLIRIHAHSYARCETTVVIFIVRLDSTYLCIFYLPMHSKHK